MEKWNTKTHIELNKAYVYGYYEDGTNNLQAMCFIMSADSNRYSGI